MAKIYTEYKNSKPVYGYKKISKWLKIDHTYITKNHRLADYANSDGGKCLELDYFRYKGKQYSLGQFERLSYPIMFEDDDGKLGVIGGFSCISHEPYFIEIHDTGEAVRLWEEIRLEEQ